MNVLTAQLPVVDFMYVCVCLLCACWHVYVGVGRGLFFLWHITFGVFLCPDVTFRELPICP